MSKGGERIYFTDIDFIAYNFVNNQRRLLIVMEIKRAYMIIEPYEDNKTLNSTHFRHEDIMSRFKKYKVVDSDKTTIEVAKGLNLNFIYIFYDEGSVKDRDYILVVYLHNYQDDFYRDASNKEYLDLSRLNSNYYKITTVERFKELSEMLNKKKL